MLRTGRKRQGGGLPQKVTRPPLLHWRGARVALVVSAFIAAFACTGAAVALLNAGGTPSPSRPTLRDALARQAQADLENIGPTTSLANAKSQVPFQVVVPDTATASKTNLGEVREAPGPGVNMTFPRPEDSSPDLDPADIHVNEAPWTGGDPHTFNQEDIAADPDAGKSICQVGSLEALCQEARSSSADGQSNGAFLRVVIGQTVFELSGGDSVEGLQAIAKSLEDQAPPSGPAPGSSSQG